MTAMENQEQQQLQKTIVQLWKKGHFYKEDKLDKVYYDFAYEHLNDLNDLVRIFGVRVISSQQHNNIYLTTLADDEDEASVITKSSYGRAISIIMVLLANIIYNAQIGSVEVPVDKYELFEDFVHFMPQTGDEKSLQNQFSKALKECRENGFIKYAIDDENTIIILPYIKCKVSQAALNEYKAELKSQQKPFLSKEEFDDEE